MRVAQIGSFHEAVALESVAPEGRMIAMLASGLLRLGHDVTVFASGDSATAADIVAIAPRAMRSYPSPKRHLAEALAMLALEKAFATMPSFDLIHVHAGLSAFPLMRRSPVPVVATVYGTLDAPEVLALYRTFHELALIATSPDQVSLGSELNWQAMIPMERDGLHPLDPCFHDQLAHAHETVYEWKTLTDRSGCAYATWRSAVHQRDGAVPSVHAPARKTRVAKGATAHESNRAESMY